MEEKDADEAAVRDARVGHTIQDRKRSRHLQKLSCSVEICTALHIHKQHETGGRLVGSRRPSLRNTCEVFVLETCIPDAIASFAAGGAGSSAGGAERADGAAYLARRRGHRAAGGRRAGRALLQLMCASEPLVSFELSSCRRSARGCISGTVECTAMSSVNDTPAAHVAGHNPSRVQICSVTGAQDAKQGQAGQ